ncbi:hypothetical protein RchiOBHm_Chr6g0300951 [Rosa chinensis]|uniref:Uncharacterized protein n=1 Tax=Rosa chinensis TaxID=74649 RepID=A0A2P6PYK8_ROSCH|nr:hypothetical protein RchiOBHm_Chr6g0300951 [Rosa chinensis]
MRGSACFNLLALPFSAPLWPLTLSWVLSVTCSKIDCFGGLVNLFSVPFLLVTTSSTLRGISLLFTLLVFAFCKGAT